MMVATCARGTAVVATRVGSARVSVRGASATLLAASALCVASVAGVSPAQALTVDCSESIAPCVATVGPTSGSTAGGTVVAVSGVNLRPVQQVWFGNGQGTILSNDGSSMTVRTPVHAVGTVDVLFEDESSYSLIAGEAHTFTFTAPALKAMKLSVTSTAGKGRVGFTGTTGASATVKATWISGKKAASTKAKSNGTFSVVIKADKGKQTFQVTATKAGSRTMTKTMTVTVK